MPRFFADSIVLCYQNLESAKKWWIDVFGCKQRRVPPDWDDPLPSDVALMLPGDTSPTILLSDSGEVRQAGIERLNGHTVIFTANVENAHEYFFAGRLAPSPIQERSGPPFFQLRDPEGNVIEICEAA